MKLRVLAGLFLALLVIGCEKDVDQFFPDPNGPVDQVTFKASAFVEVQDINGTPVQDVTIQLDNIQATTDEDGVAHLKNVDMHPSTYLTAEKSGYFHGSRRFYPSAGHTHFVKITLLPATIVGSVHSGTGGSITVSGGVKLEIPANAIADQSGNPYDGTVNIAAQPIPANDPDLSTKMPGDLVGTRDNGETGALASMGMVAVELQSATGEVLQVKEGSTVQLRIEVPSVFIGNAPQTIPMWYFDEDSGLWNEDGSATLQGTEYVAEVKHFSYWNCDAWFPIVKWGATFQYDDGSPASQVSVCITILSLDAKRCAQTNDDGFVCGMVAADELLLMEVVDPCGNVVYSEQIGPYSDTTMIGPITIPSSNVSTTVISGSTEDCDGNPVTNGFARVRVGQTNYFADLDDSGNFTLTTINCDESQEIVTVVDETALKQSLPQTFDYAPVIDAGTISVCEDLQEFIDLEVVGFPDHYLFLLPSAGVIQGGTITRIVSQDSTGNGSYFYMTVPGVTTGTYNQVPAEIGVELPTQVFVYGTMISVTITYFGEVGDFIQGSLTGTWSTNPQGGGTTYPLNGTFSVMRDQ